MSDALMDFHGKLGFGEHSQIRMTVRIYEPWGNYQSRTIELLRGALQRTWSVDRQNPVSSNRQVAFDSWAASAVDYGASLENQIWVLDHRSSFAPESFNDLLTASSSS